MVKATYGDYLTLAAIGVVGYLALKNWGTVSSIGSGVSGKISTALQTVDSKIGAAAKE